MKKIICSLMFLGAMFVMTDSAYGAMNCPETPAPNEVLLYTEENFQGECTSYIGFNREIKQHKSMVRSLKIGSGIQVELYKLYRFRGKSLYESRSEIPVFDPREKRGNWRSIRLTKKPAPSVSPPQQPCTYDDKLNPGVEAAAEQVTIFTEPNFGGSCKTINYTGRNPKRYSYSIPYSAPNKQEFWNDETRRKRKPTFNSMMVGSGVVVTVCTGENLQGTCKEFTNTVIDLTGEGFGYNSINSYKIFASDPKVYKNPMLPNDSQVTICQERVFGGGCRKLNVGNYDLNSLVYRYIHVGKNAKAQTYDQRSFYGDFEVYQGGSKQAANSQIKSVRVMSSSDELMAIKVRPTPVPIPISTPMPTPISTPVSTPVATTPVAPRRTNTPTVNTSIPKSPIDGAIRLVGKTELGLTVQSQRIQNNTNIILHSGLNYNWIMRPDGAIVLKDNPQYGLTVKNQSIANGSEIILHEGYNRWTVLSNGAIVLKDNPSFGLTVLNQNLNENAKIILHSGYNTWTKDHTSSNNVASNTNNRPPPPPKANHYPPPNSGGSPYVLCGYENQYCSFRGIGTVAYGVNGIFKYKRNVKEGIQCDDATFGFVVKDVKKRCYFKFERDVVRNTTPRETDRPSPPNGNFTVCGVEGGTCDFRGVGIVAYGYNDKKGRKFIFKRNVNSSIACNNRTFGGDPAPGKAKVCYVQIVN